MSVTNRRFTNYDRSATTGLDYPVNRQYDSRQGRSTQVDPLGMAGASLADPQTLNMYSLWFIGLAKDALENRLTCLIVEVVSSLKRPW